MNPDETQKLATQIAKHLKGVIINEIPREFIEALYDGRCEVMRPYGVVYPNWVEVELCRRGNRLHLDLRLNTYTVASFTFDGGPPQ